MQDQKSYADHYNNNELKFWLDLSTKCNAGCPQCHRTNPDGLDKVDWLPIVEWTLEEFKKAFSPTTMQHISHFDICGTWGDPMMNKDIFKICEYIIKNSQSKIIINTNGSMKSPDWWWDLGIVCGDRLIVIFAIDGISQESHSKYRQNTKLKNVMHNMESLAMTKSHAEVYTVVFAHNQKEIALITKASEYAGARSIFFVPSNRFKPGKFFYNFINRTGENESLYKTTIAEDHDIFWNSMSLTNEDTYERIFSAL